MASFQAQAIDSSKPAFRLDQKTTNMRTNEDLADDMFKKKRPLVMQAVSSTVIQGKPMNYIKPQPQYELIGDFGL